MSIEQAAQDKQADRDLEDMTNLRDNQTKLAIAQSNTEGGNDEGLDNEFNKLEADRQKRLEEFDKFNQTLTENKRQFNEKMKREDKKIAKTNTTK